VLIRLEWVIILVNALGVIDSDNGDPILASVRNGRIAYEVKLDEK
jgi:hypothetical protein